MTEPAPDELARLVAAEFGAGALTETEAELKREKTRGFGIVEAATIGAFIAQAAQLAVQIHMMRHSKPELISALYSKTASSTKIPEETRRSIVGRIVDRLTAGSD